MIECIKAFKKSTPIITIVNYLEMRYNALVSFSAVYYQFRGSSLCLEKMMLKI